VTRKAVRDLAYGDLFELADLPAVVWAEVDELTRTHARFAFARVQSESYCEGDWLWLDTSFGFFRLDPGFAFEVHRNEPDMFAPRGKP
jgi:hypothetical protein